MVNQMNMEKLLCVYCASSRQRDRKYHDGAEAVGRGLVARGWGLVYGGGNVGLMGTVAHAVKAAGGHVVGVIPEFMIARELGHVVGVIPEFMIARELAFHNADELITVTT